MPKTTYLRNENLKTIKPGYPGNKIINGKFANGEELYHPSLLSVLKWKFTTNPQKEEKENDPFKVKVNPITASTFSGKTDTIIWLGHATFYFRLGGISFITDPVFFDLPFIKRKTAMPISPEDIRNLDFILLSHGHRDHLDERSLKILFKNNPQVKVLGPLKITKLIRNFAPEVKIEEAGWFQQFTSEANLPADIFYLPARHWYRRGLEDMNEVLWGSFLVRYKRKSIFFAGDSATGSHFREIKELLGSPDICLMPIGAYKPAFLMQKSHVNPQEAAEAFNQLNGKTFIPMHYGTFDLSDEPPGEPLKLIREIAAKNQLNGKLLTPAIGEQLFI